MSEWNGDERRATSTRDIMQLVEHVDRRLLEHREDSHARHMELIARLEGAFPDGDAAAHRKYHELLMKREEWKQGFRDRILGKLAENGVWALLVGLSLLCWYGIQVAIGRGPH